MTGLSHPAATIPLCASYKNDSSALLYSVCSASAVALSTDQSIFKNLYAWLHPSFQTEASHLTFCRSGREADGGGSVSRNVRQTYCVMHGESWDNFCNHAGCQQMKLPNKVSLTRKKTTKL